MKWKKVVSVSAAAVAAPVIVYAVLAIATGRDSVWETLLGPVERSPVRFGTLSPGDRPNRFLVCPPGVCAATPDAESPDFPVSAERLRRAWDRMIATEPLAMAVDDSVANQQTYEIRTRWLRFPDTVTVRFIDLGENRSTLAVYSRSHYGYSDFGLNRRRVEGWLRALEADLGNG